MTTVGRNDPCPCGSGRKYKKCCLGKTETSAVAFTREERDTAWAQLARFSAREEFAASRTMARTAFWAEWAGRRTEADLDRAMDLEESQAAFGEWLMLDHRLPDGSTLVDLLLTRESDQLRTGERRYLERMRPSHVRPYEVTRVRVDEGLDLRDLWTRETIQVRERRATHQLVQWDVLVARVVLGEYGFPVVDGHAYVLPATETEPLLERLGREHRDFERRFPASDLAQFFKQVAPLLFHVWLDRVALRPLPKVVTAEGDEVMLAKTLFDIVDADALTAALAGHPALERQDDGTYTWFEEMDRASAPIPPARSSGLMIHSERWPPEGDTTRRGLGTVIVERGRLVLETMSKARAERGRRLLEEAAGGTVKYRATRYETVERVVERVQSRSAPQKAPPVPPEIQAQLMHAYFEQHYRTWPDQPVPALDNRTPREAAKLPSERPRLISLLKEMEVMAERDRRAGRPAYDFTWLWAELGLERPS